MNPTVKNRLGVRRIDFQRTLPVLGAKRQMPQRGLARSSARCPINWVEMRVRSTSGRRDLWWDRLFCKQQVCRLIKIGQKERYDQQFKNN